MLNIARHFLKERKREERTEIRNKPASTEQATQLPRSSYWFSKRNAYRANLWRFRKRIASDAKVRKFGFPQTGTLPSPYAAYREMVKKRFPEQMDESRLDAAIALYMRCAGYTMQEVANELFRHTPAGPHSQSRDGRIEYGAEWFGTPLGRQEILMLPMSIPRRNRFGTSSENSKKVKRRVYRQYAVKFYG